MFSQKEVRLFWWDEKRFHKLPYENYGDLMSKYIVEKVSGKTVRWANPKGFSLFKKKVFFGIGSILAHANENCIVWGSGIISKSIHVQNAKFTAVRGPQTQKYLVDLGYDVPEVYGDPAILLPLYFRPPLTKKYKVGIIPHKEDLKLVQKSIRGIDGVCVIPLATNDIEKTTIQILECEAIISSSLHGLIVPHSYGIPAVWQRFSNKLFGDDIKFQDYFESVQMKSYFPEILDVETITDQLHLILEKNEVIPNPTVISKMQNELLEVSPF